MPYKRISGIYKIINIKNNKIYIGSAVSILARFQNHKMHLKKGTHKNRHLQNAWCKYGSQFFKFEILENVSKEQLILREQFWLDKTQCYNNQIGYNICTVANSTLGTKRTKETREKISKAVKAYITKDHLDEMTKLAAIANKGRKKSPVELANWINSRSRKWLVIDPDGNSKEITNLNKFCRENNLLQGKMSRVGSGLESHHRGWRCTKLSSNNDGRGRKHLQRFRNKSRKNNPDIGAKISIRKKRSWKIITPEGQETITKDLIQFCKQNNLNPFGMRKIARSVRLYGRKYTYYKYQCFGPLETYR